MAGLTASRFPALRKKYLTPLIPPEKVLNGFNSPVWLMGLWKALGNVV